MTHRALLLALLAAGLGLAALSLFSASGPSTAFD